MAIRYLSVLGVLYFVASMITACQGFEPTKKFGQRDIILYDKQSPDPLSEVVPSSRELEDLVVNDDFKVDASQPAAHSSDVILGLDIQAAQSEDQAEVASKVEMRALLRLDGQLIEVMGFLDASDESAGRMTKVNVKTLDPVSVSQEVAVRYELQAYSMCSDSCATAFVQLQVNRSRKAFASAHYSFKKDEATGKYQIDGTSVGEAYLSVDEAWQRVISKVQSSSAQQAPSRASESSI